MGLRKTLLKLQAEEKNTPPPPIEVVGFSIASCLECAAHHWDVDLISLDYEVVERGKQSFWKSVPIAFIYIF